MVVTWITIVSDILNFKSVSGITVFFASLPNIYKITYKNRVASLLNQISMARNFRQFDTFS